MLSVLLDPESGSADKTATSVPRESFSCAKYGTVSCWFSKSSIP